MVRDNNGENKYIEGIFMSKMYNWKWKIQPVRGLTLDNVDIEISNDIISVSLDIKTGEIMVELEPDNCITFCKSKANAEFQLRNRIQTYREFGWSVEP